MSRVRALLAGPLSVVLVVVMFVGCLMLWVGIPLGWLWVGSQIQASASLGLAIAIRRKLSAAMTSRRPNSW